MHAIVSLTTPAAALAYYRAVKGTIFAQARSVSRPLSKRTAKQGKRFVRLLKNKNSRSMMHTGSHPKGMAPTWSTCDSRTRALFAKHRAREERNKALRAAGK